MKNYQKVWAILLILMISSIFYSCTPQDNEIKSVEKLHYIDKDSIIVPPGG